MSMIKDIAVIDICSRALSIDFRIYNVLVYYKINALSIPVYSILTTEYMNVLTGKLVPVLIIQ